MGRPKTESFDKSVSDDVELNDSSKQRYTENSEDNTDSYILTPFENHADPGDFGINTNTGITGYNDSNLNNAGNNEFESDNSEESIIEGVDYSKPAYFRQQKESEEISEEYEVTSPDFEDAALSNISAEYGDDSTAGSSEYYEEEFQDINIADIDNSVYEISKIEEAVNSDLKDDSIDGIEEDSCSEIIELEEAEIFEDDGLADEVFIRRT